MFRTLLSAVASLLLAGGLWGAEYKNATIKGRGERGVILLEVDGKEIPVTPSMVQKAYDLDGKLIKPGTDGLTNYAASFTIFKEGNVVDVKTEKKGRTEFFREIHLVQGELLKPGKATVKEERGGKMEGKVYQNATVKAVDGVDVTLTTSDGDEVTLKPALLMRALLTNGRQLNPADKMRVFKEGNVLVVKTEKKGKELRIVEARMVRGSLAVKEK